MRASRTIALAAIAFLLLIAVIGNLVVGCAIRSGQRKPLSEPVPTTASQAPIPTPTASAVETDDNDPLGLPISTRPLQILHREHFTIGYDNERREPAWASYHLSGPIRFHGAEKRPPRFTTDTETHNAARHEDYTNSGFDRGHMTPAFAMWSRFGDEAMRSTFTTSNIVPQLHAMNAGAWEQIEALIAGRYGQGGGWAEAYGDVWVTAGPVHTTNEPTITGGEPVPTACFMVVTRCEGDRWQVLGVEVPNRAVDTKPSDFYVPVFKIESETGLNFDAALPSDEQLRVEMCGKLAEWK